jgi:hypothetical protein
VTFQNKILPLMRNVFPIAVAYILTCTFLSCGNKQHVVDFVDEETHTVPVGDTTAVIAKVIRQPMVNKAGRVLEGGEYYLVYDGDERFIKFTESSIDPSDLEPYLDKTIEFRLIEREGLWDTDNPNVQSRIGKYVAVLEIVGR